MENRFHASLLVPADLLAVFGVPGSQKHHPSLCPQLRMVYPPVSRLCACLCPTCRFSYRHQLYRVGTHANDLILPNDVCNEPSFSASHILGCFVHVPVLAQCKTLTNNRHLFLIVVGPGSQGSRRWQIQCLVRTCFLVRSGFSLCPHLAAGVRELSGASFIRALIQFMWASPS